jgi:hypothetical protein
MKEVVMKVEKMTDLLILDQMGLLIETISFIRKFRASRPSLFLRGTPLFTKRLFEGISVAEEPLKKKGKESFGQHRCRIISEGIFKAYRNNVLNKHEVLGRAL